MPRVFSKPLDNTYVISLALWVAKATFVPKPEERMTTIWKYPLDITDEQTIEIPRTHKFLTVQTQDGQICLWALVNEDEPTIEKRIAVYGTGHPIPVHCGHYLGTAQTAEGLFVWHVFVV